MGDDSPGGLSQGGDSPGGRFPNGVCPRGNRFPWGDDSQGEMTPRGPMVKDAALGSQRSRVRIPPPPGAEIRPRCPRMLRSRFWLQNQDFGASVGAICIIFRDLSVPTGPGDFLLNFLPLKPGPERINFVLSDGSLGLYAIRHPLESGKFLSHVVKSLARRSCNHYTSNH